MTTHINNAWSAIVRGVALGDAWGDPNEFKSIDALTATDRRGPECPALLDVTDDTQMTLYLAKALDNAHGEPVRAIQKSIQEQFLAYLHDPDFAGRAPGITVTGSLRRLDAGRPWQSATDSHSDGCGTVMRVTPAALTDDWVGVAAFQAAVTHGTAVGIASAILNAALVRQAVTNTDVQAGHMVQLALRLSLDCEAQGLLNVGTWLDGLYPIDLARGFSVVTKQLAQARNAQMDGYNADPWAADPCDFGGQGWRSHECLTTALLAVDAFPDQPWEALRRAVTTNGDSDSIGAVAGGLLGALHGEFWPDEEILTRLEPRYLIWIEESDSYRF